MEGDPYLLLEGMAIAGLAVGATEGYIYLRSEYPDALVVLTTAIQRARAAGWLGADVLGSGKAFGQADGRQQRHDVGRGAVHPRPGW